MTIFKHVFLDSAGKALGVEKLHVEGSGLKVQDSEAQTTTTGISTTTSTTSTRSKYVYRCRRFTFNYNTGIYQTAERDSFIESAGRENCGSSVTGRSEHKPTEFRWCCKFFN